MPLGCCLLTRRLVTSAKMALASSAEVVVTSDLFLVSSEHSLRTAFATGERWSRGCLTPEPTERCRAPGWPGRCGRRAPPAAAHAGPGSCPGIHHFPLLLAEASLDMAGFCSHHSLPPLGTGAPHPHLCGYVPLLGKPHL